MPNIFRGAQAQVNRSDLSGRRVWKGAAAAANWWDPNQVGLSIAGAYRAINSVGTPWGGGPAAYLQTLVNQANPGVNDLVEGAGGVPWAQATGWGFVAAFAQWFDTGLIPVNDQSWSMFVQYANAVLGNFYIAGLSGGVGRLFALRLAAGAVSYQNGFGQSPAPGLATGNVGVAGNRGMRNGVLEGGAIAAWAGASVISIYVGARRLGGVPGNFITADIEAVAIYSGGVAAVRAQAAAIVAAMAAL